MNQGRGFRFACRHLELRMAAQSTHEELRLQLARVRNKNCYGLE
jgi:hypothetical protein